MLSLSLIVFSLPKSVCALKLRNLPTRTNQWPTQSRILLPTAVNSECFRGRWKHLIMISISGKTSISLRMNIHR